MISSLHENPRTSINWRHYRSGCPHYRVRWFIDGDYKDGGPLYQVYCLHNTPPETQEEQDKCLASRTQCWRIAERAEGQADIPLSSVKRREPSTPT
ncbi:MAG: hypothetical protein ACHQ4H_08930 [Ktedonobacterales bacterium]